MTRVLWTAALSALVLVGVASGSTSRESSKVVVRLRPAGVVPQPASVLPGARGTFTGWFDDGGDGAVKFEFRLSYAGLTGPATSAHVHAGKSGRRGPALVTLCSRGRCSGAQASFGHVSRALVESLGAGAYVDVHTVRNPRGELRGQLAGVSIG